MKPRCSSDRLRSQKEVLMWLRDGWPENTSERDKELTINNALYTIDLAADELDRYHKIIDGMEDIKEALTGQRMGL